VKSLIVAGFDFPLGMVIQIEDDAHIGSTPSGVEGRNKFILSLSF
jgi:hypothetical protein